MADPIVFVDTETTGLDPDRHEVWDIAIIEADGTEHEWHVRPRHLWTAEPGALRVNRFFERTGSPGWEWRIDGLVEPDYAQARLTAAIQIAQLTANKHIVGAVPSFDAVFLDRFIRSQGGAPAFHYHLCDIENLAVGYLRGRQRRAGRPATDLIRPPWDSHALSDALGIDSSTFGERHTAIADARWAKAIWDKVMNGNLDE